MHDAAALWSVGYITAAEVVRNACDLVVAGHDGPALRMLTAVPFRNADEEVPEVLKAALTDIALTGEALLDGLAEQVDEEEGRVAASTDPRPPAEHRRHQAGNDQVVDIGYRAPETGGPRSAAASLVPWCVIDSPS